MVKAEHQTADSLFRAAPILSRGSFNPIRVRNLTVACTTFDAAIDTEHGTLPIEKVAPGMRIWTRNASLVQIRGYARFRADADFLDRNTDLIPVKVHFGSMGIGAPFQDLVMAQSHCVHLPRPIARRLKVSTNTAVPTGVLNRLPGVVLHPRDIPIDYVALLIKGRQELCIGGLHCTTFSASDELLEALFEEAPSTPRNTDRAPSVSYPVRSQLGHTDFLRSDREAVGKQSTRY